MSENKIKIESNIDVLAKTSVKKVIGAQGQESPAFFHRTMLGTSQHIVEQGGRIPYSVLLPEIGSINVLKDSRQELSKLRDSLSSLSATESGLSEDSHRAVMGMLQQVLEWLEAVEEEWKQ